MWKHLVFLLLLVVTAASVGVSLAQAGFDAEDWLALNRSQGGGGGGLSSERYEDRNAITNTNTWAVIVDTSRYWLNYRHATNAVAMYQAVKRLGIPDSRVLLMLAEDFAHNPRNVFEKTLFLDPDLKVNVHKEKVQVDYSGDEVSVESLARLLTGRHRASLPRSKRLSSNARSNVVVYITGHGGENYMKFQDSEQMMGEDFAGILAQMHLLERYGNLLVVVETCKASTFCQHISSPNTVCIASSLRGQNSYSKHSSEEIGNSLVDEMTYHLFRSLSRMNTNKKKKNTKGEGEGGRDVKETTVTLMELFRGLERKLEYSTPYLGTYNLDRDPSEVKVSEFFS